MKQLIEMNADTDTLVIRAMERFKGDAPKMLQALRDTGIYFGRPTSPDPVEEKDAPAETEAPKEWIEHQEEERRAWAVSEAVRVAREWPDGGEALVPLAEKIVTFVKGSNPDFNDVEAMDEFYLTMNEAIELEFEEGIKTEEQVHEFLVNTVDTLVKRGVRLKDGKRLEEEA